MHIGTIQDAYLEGNAFYASLKDIEENPYDQTLHPGHWNHFKLGWVEHPRVSKEEVELIERTKEFLRVYSKYPKNSPRPTWTVLYNISTPGSSWIGTGWEFFDDEKLAQKRYDALSKFSETPNELGFKYCPCKRPYYPICDRAHLGAVHAWNKEG